MWVKHLKVLKFPKKEEMRKELYDEGLRTCFSYCKNKTMLVISTFPTPGSKWYNFFIHTHISFWAQDRASISN